VLSISQGSVDILKFNNSPLVSIHNNHHTMPFHNSHSIVIQEPI
jgi:hypothetical protein